MIFSMDPKFNLKPLFPPPQNAEYLWNGWTFQKNGDRVPIETSTLIAYYSKKF
jgi:hypothetical protein